VISRDCGQRFLSRSRVLKLKAPELLQTLPIKTFCQAGPEGGVSKGPFVPFVLCFVRLLSAFRHHSSKLRGFGVAGRGGGQDASDGRIRRERTSAIKTSTAEHRTTTRNPQPRPHPKSGSRAQLSELPPSSQTPRATLRVSSRTFLRQPHYHNSPQLPLIAACLAS
jgi:hypothetical protein